MGIPFRPEHADQAFNRNAGCLGQWTKPQTRREARSFCIRIATLSLKLRVGPSLHLLSCFVVRPVVDCLADVPLLALLVSTAEQDHETVAVFREVKFDSRGQSRSGNYIERRPTLPGTSPPDLPKPTPPMGFFVPSIVWV